MGHLYHGYVSHNQRVQSPRICGDDTGSIPFLAPNFHEDIERIKRIFAACEVGSFSDRF